MASDPDDAVELLGELGGNGRDQQGEDQAGHVERPGQLIDADHEDLGAAHDEREPDERLGHGGPRWRRQRFGHPAAKSPPPGQQIQRKDLAGRLALELGLAGGPEVTHHVHAVGDHQ